GAPGGTGSTFQYERRDGGSRWLRLAASPMVGHSSGTVLVAHDVTAELEAERAKSSFVAAVSHELRTPLTPLKGYLTLFASGQIQRENADSREYFESMLNQANRLERLIDDLLEVSALEAGKPNVRVADVDVVPLVERAVAEAMAEHPGRA